MMNDLHVMNVKMLVFDKRFKKLLSERVQCHIFIHE